MNVDELLVKRPRRILLVDDEEDICDSLRDILEASLDNVEVETAANGKAGLETLRSSDFDLVITDYKMPGMNGIDFLLAAAKEAPKVPKVLMTAFPDLEIALQAINDAKIANFFTKPLEPGTVLDTVGKILDERDQQTRRDQAMARSMRLARPGATKE